MQLADVPRDLEAAKALVSRLVYEGAIVFEKMEHAGVVSGNGHHMAQNISSQAVALLEERWTGSRPEASPKKP